MLLSTLKGLRLVLHLLTGLVLAAAVNLDGRGRLSGPHCMQWWCQRLLRVLDIRLQVQGAPAPGARFSVANHVSWLDMILIGACEPTRFVSKSEVQHWPLAGALTNAAGTFYLRRGKGGAGPLIERLIPHLAGGGSVLVFPEGTTSNGHGLLPFHPRLFAAAIESGCQVQSIALQYAPDGQGRDVAPFIGDDDLVSHVLRVLQTPHLDACIHYGVPVSAAGRTREALADQARAEIQLALQQPLPRAAPAAGHDAALA